MSLFTNERDALAHTLLAVFPIASLPPRPPFLTGAVCEPKLHSMLAGQADERICVLSGSSCVAEHGPENERKTMRVGQGLGMLAPYGMREPLRQYFTGSINVSVGQ